MNAIYDQLALYLYGKKYNQLEPHQQYDVRQSVDNPDY